MVEEYNLKYGPEQEGQPAFTGVMDYYAAEYSSVRYEEDEGTTDEATSMELYGYDKTF